MGAARVPKGSKGQKRPADVIGNAVVAEWAMQANRNPPQLKTFDR